VKVMVDKVFVFCMWDGQHFILDKQTGIVLTKGKGDNALKAYADLVSVWRNASCAG
jgi:hypothetical protein